MIKALTPSVAPEDIAACLLPTVLFALPCGVAVVDAQSGRILVANYIWQVLSGTYGSGGVGQLLQTLFPIATSILDEALLNTGAIRQRAVAAVVPPSGVATWYDLELLPHPDQQGAIVVMARDVTDDVLARHDAEKTQKPKLATGVRLVLAQQAIDIGKWQWNVLADTQSLIPEQFRLLGFDPERDTPPPFFHLIETVHSRDRAGLVACIKTGFRGGRGAHQIEYRIERADTGEERWVLSLGRTITDARNGRPTRVIGVSVDVTTRRSEQLALAESETRLRLAFEAAQIFVWDWDVPSGRITWVEGLEKAAGLPKGGFGGTVEAFRALVHPEDATMVEAALGRALRGETAEYSAEFRMRRADDTWRWTATRAIVVRDQNGAPVRLVGVDHDITPQREAEASLRASEDRLHLAMQFAGFGAWESDSATGIVIRDVALSSLLGMPLERTMVSPGGWFDVVHADDRARVIAAYAKTANGGPPFREDFWVTHPSGKDRLLSGRAILASVGRIVGIAQDITDSQSAKARQFESASRFAGLFESMVEFVGLLSLDGTILNASRATINLLGLTHDQVVGQKIWDMSCLTKTPGASDRVRRSVANAAAGKLVRYQIEVRGASRAATIDFTLRPLRDNSGAVILLVPEGSDISTRRAVRAALAKSEARFRRIVESLPLHIYTTDASGHNDFINRHWFDYSGQKAGDALGLGWANAMHPDDRERTLAIKQAAFATGRPFEVEYRLRRRDGSYGWFLSRTVPLLAEGDETSPRWIGAATEISALVDARDAGTRQAELLQTWVAAQERSLGSAALELNAEIQRRADVHDKLLHAQKLEALGQLTGSVVHDFNNVLAAVAGSYTLIRRRTESDAVLDIVRAGEQAVERAAKLIERILVFARRDSKAPTTLDVRKTLHELETLLVYAAGEVMQCSLDMQDDVWPIAADPQELGIALLNLVVNARDAMPAGGKITVFARNLATPPGELKPGLYVAIGVRDSGEGMPPEILAKARDPFFTTKPQGKGTGLGLAMVQDFASNSDGCLLIDSAEKRGTTVQIILPKVAMTESTPVRMADLKEISARSLALHGNARILLVENDEHLRPITAAFLQDLGYDVLQAANAEAATALFHKGPQVNLLITDIGLKGESGPELASSLLMQQPSLPVLFITGGSIVNGLDGHPVLLKPFASKLLAKAVLRLLSRKVTVDPAIAEPLLSRMVHPGLRAILLAWHAAKAGGEGFPHPALLNPQDFGLTANAFQAKLVSSDPPLFHYQSIGQALLDQGGTYPEGGELVSIDANGVGFIGTLAGAYRRCALKREPVYQSADYNFGDDQPFHFERLILPASNDGHTINHLVGIVLFNSKR